MTAGQREQFEAWLNSEQFANRKPSYMEAWQAAYRAGALAMQERLWGKVKSFSAAELNSWLESPAQVLEAIRAIKSEEL